MSTSEATTLEAPKLSLELIQAAAGEAQRVRAVTGVEESQLLVDDTSPPNGTPEYYETPTNGESVLVAPRAPSAQLGPFHADIRFGGGIPVGGWSQLTLHSNGAWNFSGHLRNSGFPSYNDTVTWGVQSIRTGDLYIWRHKGHMAGTLEWGSRNDDWGDSGTNPALAAGWNMLAPAWRWHCRAHVNWDILDSVNQLIQIINAAQAIGRVITML